MKSVICSIAFIAAALVTATPATAQDKPGKESEKKFQYVQVNRFDVKSGVDLPADYQLTIVENLSTELGKIKGVKQVLREGETAPEEQPVLLITGEVTKYKKGSQAARYLVGFGAGSTVIDAHIKCFDAATKELLLEKDVDGKVVMGVIGGKSEGANNGLAKEIAKNVKQKFFKN